MLEQIRDHQNYYVSDDGSVYRRRKQGLFKLAPDWSNNYARVCLDGKNESIARLVLNTFDPIDDPTLIAFHIDGNHHNNHLSNLIWMTASQVQLYSGYTLDYRKQVLTRGRS